MREILFRGKRLEICDWVEGSLIAYPDGDCYIARPSDDPNVLDKFCADPATVCQYTGLTDKNGKKIFEGDVLLLDDIKGFVNYGTGCFCVKLSCPDYLYRNNPAIDIVLNEYPGLVVIGNIHDQPELLEAT